MDVFNPKILDASIRDVASCLSDNQKADLLLYAMKSLHYEGRFKTVIENAIQSCLQVCTLSPENTAKARILRARARLSSGFSANDDLEAALEAEPDNPEAKALLHQRSVAVEKLLAPLPPNPGGRFSIEIWREIALFLPRQDLRSLLFVPHAVSRVASLILFRELDLHFCGPLEDDDEDGAAAEAAWDSSPSGRMAQRESDSRHAQRSADILTRIIVDPVFAIAVRTLRIYAPRRDKDGAMAFQTGMLTNALPKLTNLRNVHISACSESIGSVFRVLNTSNTRLKGLSVHSPDGPADLSFLDFRHLSHFSYITTSGSPGPLYSFLQQNRATLRTLTLDNLSWSFPTECVSVRNLTHVNFSGHFPLNSQALADIIVNGRQLESLTIDCALDCMASSQIRSLISTPSPMMMVLGNQHHHQHHPYHHPHAGHTHPPPHHPSSGPILPFLRHFSFTVHALGRRTVDRDLFPALTEFLRDKTQLRTLGLVSYDETVQRNVGFDASVWGVLPSLTNLKGLVMSYPKDLAPGLAAWLVPRSVRALTLDCTALAGREMIPFLNQLKVGVPPTLRYVGLLDCPIRNVSTVIEAGFPMVAVVRLGQNYWTVKKKLPMGMHSHMPGHGPGMHAPGAPATPAVGSAGGGGTGPGGGGGGFGGGGGNGDTMNHPPPPSSGVPSSASSPAPSITSSGTGTTGSATAGTSNSSSAAHNPPPHHHHHPGNGAPVGVSPSTNGGGGSPGGSSTTSMNAPRLPPGADPNIHYHTHPHPHAPAPAHHRDTHPPHGHGPTGGYTHNQYAHLQAGSLQTIERERYGMASMTGITGITTIERGIGVSAGAVSMVQLVTAGGGYELEMWPKRRVLYHLGEWLEWLGCEDALPGVPPEFPVSV
ncbi:hypothetical protein BDN72DRAFT_485629 [Pluteus cervinus]|uniref:Uncharacterized protein n=1 Tax=Pluteus cervinus TaxID=181527 RepID=A0ACD3A5T4_9AGAR|nr:hypothetical protein BDN72DRAFT_485629 [Pluteus cervinus]